MALICHEEGKLLDLPLNRYLRLEDTGEIYDIIAGAFFLCAAPPDSDRFESLSPEQIERYTKRFQDPEYFPAAPRGEKVALRKYSTQGVETP